MSSLLQHCHEFVRGAEVSRSKSRGGSCVECCQLFGWVRSQVDLCGLHRRVTEPQGHLSDIVGGLQYVHRAGVQDVGRDALPGDRGDSIRGYGDMFGEDVLESRPSHGTGSRVQEQLMAGVLCSNAEPGPHCVCSLLPERQDALLAPIPSEAILLFSGHAR